MAARLRTPGLLSSIVLGIAVVAVTLDFTSSDDIAGFVTSASLGVLTAAFAESEYKLKRRLNDVNNSQDDFLKVVLKAFR